MIFATLQPDAGVRHALGLNLEAGRLLAAYHEQILRGDSPLTVADRELVAAYVSGLNRCSYCHGTHSVTAQLFGVPRDLIDSLVADEELKAAPEKLRPLLSYSRKLTLHHNQVTAEDAQAVYRAGWCERALHDLILVTCMFNFMNRFVHGHGISGDENLWADRGRYLYEHGYSGVVEAGLLSNTAAT